MSACLHCGAAFTPSGQDEDSNRFCCHGCAAAYSLVRGAGLEAYYKRRCLDASAQPLRPEEESDGLSDVSAYVSPNSDGSAVLYAMVEGVQCGACIWLIESLLGRHPAVMAARVNMTTRRLTLRFRPDRADIAAIIDQIRKIGYRLVPYDPQHLTRHADQSERELLRAMAISGFAAANVMLFSVSIWAGHAQGMDAATRDLFHWISALIALPAIVWCVRPFARSALAALRAGRTNMDVPITLGVALASATSLFETIQGGQHAYFDAAISLLFFLLIGRYLDSRARGRAHGAVQNLVALNATAVTVLQEDGRTRSLSPSQVAPGMIVLVAAGQRIGVDGVVKSGISDVDCSLITGESIPNRVEAGSKVFAGTLNLSAPLTLQVEARGQETLLADIVRMMEAAEQGRARYVALADRLARWYAPVVHIAALATFCGWLFAVGVPWQQAMMCAVAVLIITCPCALALAVPVVQVVASSRLMRQGILLKSATALERLTRIDHVVFDKTGTLTKGRLDLMPPDQSVPDCWSEEDLSLAASLAATSTHPLSKALHRACPTAPVAENVREQAGAGLAWDMPQAAGEVRLGSRAWCGATTQDESGDGPELWLSQPGKTPKRFRFQDSLREDAAIIIAKLKELGLGVEILSGDRAQSVAAIAQKSGIEEWRALSSPAMKCERLSDLKAHGKTVLMVGDGLNDAPALAAASVSMSPSSAIDISRTAADVVFQGERLAAILEAIQVARAADSLVKQNFALALLYNLFTIPLAVAGYVTPLIAAIAMSSSSILVIVNALRLVARGR